MFPKPNPYIYIYIPTYIHTYNLILFGKYNLIHLQHVTRSVYYSDVTPLKMSPYYYMCGPVQSKHSWKEKKSKKRKKKPRINMKISTKTELYRTEAVGPIPKDAFIHLLISFIRHFISLTTLINGQLVWNHLSSLSLSSLKLWQRHVSIPVAFGCANISYIMW